MNKLVFKIGQFFNAFRFLKIMNFTSWLVYLRAMLINDQNVIRVKPNEALGEVSIRGNFVDRNVFDYVFYQKYHLPDQHITLPSQPTILDLGSNTGLTICHFKYLYPDAKIIGYEMDKDNFEMAKVNTRNLQGVTVHNTAVWVEDGTIEYNKDTKNDAFSISSSGLTTSKKVSVNSKTIQTIINDNDIEQIDYLKMDIEGAEKVILRANDLDWLNTVNAMNLELHLNEHESIDIYKSILEGQGFMVWVDNRHWSSLMVKR